MGGAGARADWLARPLMRGVIAVVGGNKGIWGSGAGTMISEFEERVAALPGRFGDGVHFTTHHKCPDNATFPSKHPALAAGSPNKPPQVTRGNSPARRGVTVSASLE